VPALSRPLVVGVTGIAGHALAERLAVRGGHLLGLSRRGTSPVREVESLHADLTDPAALQEALAGTRPWSSGRPKSFTCAAASPPARSRSPPRTGARPW
jgi:nucleoside-diphosphate-sugar epimerase